jgi:cell fate regulator YaaT (PSP1 superfamily)
MESDKAKRDPSYLPRSWGADREGRRAESPAQAPGPSDDGSSAGADPASHEDDQPAKAHILEPPINLLSSPETAATVESGTGPESGIPSDIQPPGLEPAHEDPAEPEPRILSAEEKRTRRIKINIVGVRFGYACKVYRFDAGDLELNGDDWVIVKTEKGLGLGRVAAPPSAQEIEASQLEGLRKVIRKAGKVDFDQKERLTQKEREAYTYCIERIEALGLPMKLVGVDCFFDGSKYVFFFTAEGRVDFRELVKQLVVRFPVRIEMRQIGVRHEAKMTGGIACCGQELCCARFLTDFRPVSVKMAKAQNLSLNPTKISGVCGRLMCCLGYEHDTYEQFRKGLPKVGRAVVTTKGAGVVVKHNPLARTVSVKLQDESLVEVTREEIVDIGEPTQRNNNGQDEREESLCDGDDEKDLLEFPPEDI